MKVLRIFFSLIFVFILFSNFSLPVPNEPSKKFRLAYTTSEGSNAITLINLQSGLVGSSIDLEHPPKSIAIHPDGSMAYILQEGSNTIICVDLLTGKPLHSIVLEKKPQQMVTVSKKGESYVIYENSHEIDVIDSETGISNLSMMLEGIPSRMTLTPDGKTLYVSYQGLKEVTPIDVASGAIQPTITLNDIPKSIAITKENLLAYLGESSPTKVSFYNLKSEETPEPLEIEYDINEMETNIRDINMDPDGETAYLTEGNFQSIIPVNLKTHLMDRSITVDDPIKSLTIFPVLRGNTSTTLSSSSPAAVLGQEITFTAHVSSLDLTGIPTGTVSLNIIGSHLGYSGSLDGNGNATFSMTAGERITGGDSMQLYAAYEGDSNYNPSSSQEISQEIVPIVTTVTCSPNPAEYGQTVNLNVTVTLSADSQSPAPTGTVEFFDNGLSMGMVTLSAALDGSKSSAGTLSISTLSIGSHPITAKYSGDSNNNSSSTVNPVLLFVQQTDMIPTTTTLSSSLPNSQASQSVTFTATVAANPITFPFGVYGPIGTVTFFSDGVEIGTAILTPGGASNTSMAQLTVSDLLAGSHTIIATYNSDSNYAFSFSNEIMQTVVINPTTLTFVSSKNPVDFGESVTYIVRVFSNNGVPTGGVTFYNGAAPIGTVSLYEGTAIFSMTALVAGSHSITAAYGGSANYSSSVSSPYTQQIGNIGGIIQSPRDLCGHQVIRQSRGPSKVDRVNVLKWNPPGFGAEPQYYEIYRDEALTDRVAVVPACSSTTYNDHHRRKGKTYTYYIVALSEGYASSAASITVKPYKKKHHHSNHHYHHLANKKRRANNGGRRDARIPKFNRSQTFSYAISEK